MIRGKQGFSTQNFLIGLILFTSLVVLATLMFTDLAITYNNPGIIDSKIASTYGKVNESTQRVSDSLAAVSGKGGLSLVGTFQVLFASTLTVIQIVLGALPLLSGLVNSFATDFGVPTEVAGVIFPMFLAIITIGVVFAIINSNTRKDLIVLGISTTVIYLITKSIVTIIGVIQI